MRILMNTCSYSFDVPGGGEHQLLNTKAALEKKGVKVELYNQWNPRFDQFDLVHFFTVQKGMASFCEYVKDRGMPLALSPIFWPRENAQRGEMWEIEKMLHLADVILPNSVTEAKLLGSIFDVPEKKFFVAVNAVDAPIFQSPEPERFRSIHSLEKRFLLTVGNIEERKNQLGVLQAIAGLNLDIEYVCIGNVRSKDYFDLCSTFPNFRYINALSQKELADAYAACSGFILASSFETPGLAAIEAAITGAPVCVTSVGSTKEYFGDIASYVDPENPESVKNGVLSIIDQPKLSETSKNVLMEKYSWGATADQSLLAYHSIIKVGARSR